MDNRPKGREKHITGAGKDVYKRDEGLGTGPVGSTGGNGSFEQPQQSQASGRQTTRAIGKISPIFIIIIIVLILFGGKIFGGGSGNQGQTIDPTPVTPSQNQTQPSQQDTTPSSNTTPTNTSSFSGSSLLSALTGVNGSVSNGWNTEGGGNNTGNLDTNIVNSARAKYTNIVGGGRDKVTIMVYMCGTDLESKSGMATNDLQEMLNAKISDQINLIIYTGGCRQWRNNVMSSSVNQVYQIDSNGLKRIVDDAGSPSMVSSSTLADYIGFCAKNFPADRYELIFWDHGGGSITGYGYDEKNPNAGSMTLKDINDALKTANIKFDFIGFDTCLMATLENAQMLTAYADYFIGSEETEPGVGWYYTNWLTEFSKNTSAPTLEIGKRIIDDFVSVCNQQCPGQKTTLSMVDLAELEATVPSALRSFASSTAEMLQNNQYTQLSNARSASREFAPSNKLDQVDLINLAENLGTKESIALANALRSAIKYNKTSSNMTNAYGLSIYFPYKKMSYVSQAVSMYNAIGMDSEYSRVIQQFASMEISGQAVSGGAASPLSALLGGSSSGGSSSSGDIMSILSGLLGGNMYGVSGMDSSNSSFLSSFLDSGRAAPFLEENMFDTSQLVWLQNGSSYTMSMTEDNWSLVHDLELNVFYDDGNGYIDLGLDNVFDFTDDGQLIGEFDGTWLAIDSQPVAYYHTDTLYDGDQYTITGRVPVLLNGDRADLIIVFDNDHPYGYIAGARSDYRDGETETVAKGMTELNEGDTIDFLCDYYSYNGEYLDSYKLGDQMTYRTEMEISNVYLPDANAARATYRFVDIYCQEYWTPVIPD